MGGLFTPLLKTPSNLGYFATEVRKTLFGPQPLLSLPLAEFSILEDPSLLNLE